MEASKAKSNDINPIGLRIRSIRTELGIRQDQMAALLDLTQSNYGRLELNDKRLSIVRLIEISQILTVDVNYLITGIKKGMEVITKDDYILKMDEFNKELTGIAERRKAVQKEYIMANKPFEVGDVVAVLHKFGVNRERELGYVTGFKIENNIVVPVLAKMKKNGDQSRQQLFVYGNPIYQLYRAKNDKPV